MTDRLARIQARADDCQTYNFGMRNADMLAHEDVPALLAMVRERDAALERVRELHVEDDQGKCAECTVAPFSMHSVKYPCPTIAAITATEGATDA